MNAPFNHRTTPREPFSAFLADTATEEVVRGAAGSLGWPIERVIGGGLRTAVQTLAASASPSVLLVDLTNVADPLEDINALAEVCEPGTIVLACGEMNDVRMYRELVACGIHDYLPKPFTADQLQEALARAQQDASTAGEREVVDTTPHMMATVIGVRGGVGCSTIAVSTAWILAEVKKRSTALLDLDVHFGTDALALDLEPGRGLTDAMENPGRVDGLFIERAVVRAGERLGVLSAEAPMHQPLSGDGSAFYQLQEEMRAAFVCTVLDLPRHMLIQHPTLLAGVNVAVVVTELTLAATRDTIRLLSWLRSNAPQARIILVANKVPSSGTEIGRKDFEESIERIIDLVLPYDAKLAAQAAKLGKPLAATAKGGRIGGGLTRIAELIVGEDPTDATAKKSLAAQLGALGKKLTKKPKKK